MQNKVKKTLAIILAVLVTLTCSPTFAFAGSDKPQRDEVQYNDTETAIDQTIKENVETAKEAAATVQSVVAEAKEKSSEAAEAATTALNEAAGVPAAKAEVNSLTEQAKAVKAEGEAEKAKDEKNIRNDVESAVKDMNPDIDTVNAEAAKAADEAKKAKEAAAAALTASTQEAAKQLVANAQAAAKAANNASKAAEKAYESAVKKLNAAQVAYDKAVNEANAKIKEYNEKIGNLQAGAGEAEAKVAAARKAFNEAKAKADKAAAEAAKAKETAEKADVKVQAAADAAMNFHVNPAKSEVNTAQQAKDNATTAVAEAQNDLTAKQNAYTAAIDTITAEATAYQDGVVAAKKTELDVAQARYDEAKRNYDNASFMEIIIYRAKMNDAGKALNEAQAAYDRATSESSYNTVVDTWLKASPEKQAVTEATKTLEALQEAEYQKAAELADAKAKLGDSETTRDSYIKAVSEVLADPDNESAQEAAEKIIAAVGEIVKTYSDYINATEYDKALCDWANDFYLWNAIDRSKTRTDLNNKYGSDFWRRVNDLTGLFGYSSDTEEKIDEVMSLYRAELLKAEEQVAFSNAYVAKTNSTKALAEVVEADKVAQEAAKKLAEAEAELQKAETDFNQAVEDLKAVEQISDVDVTDAKAKLDLAKEAVEEAGKLVEKAKNDKQAADNAQKDAVKKLGHIEKGAAFYILKYGEAVPTVVGRQNTAKFYSKSLGAMQLNNASAETQEILEGTTTTEKNAVESFLKAGCATGNYDESIAVIEANAKKYLSEQGLALTETRDGVEYELAINWYAFKYDIADGFHVDGEVYYKPVQAPTPTVPVTPVVPTAPTGNGGGSTTSTTKTDVTIKDEETPLSELPKEEIKDNDVPMANLSEDEILDEEVPLSELPKTGGMGVGLFFLAGAALAGAGFGIRKKND